MMSILRGLALAAALVVPAVTQAEFVIDDYSTALSLGNSLNITGSSVATNRNVTRASAQVTLGGVTGTNLNFGNAGGTPTLRSLSMTYTFPSTANLNTLDHLIGFAYTSTLSPFLVTVTAKSGAYTLQQSVVTAAGSSGAVRFDSADFGNGGAMKQVDQLILTIARQTQVAGATFNITSNFAAVPEPASVTLLGLTAVGGFLARRRRNKLNRSVI